MLLSEELVMNPPPDVEEEEELSVRTERDVSSTAPTLGTTAFSHMSTTTGTSTNHPMSPKSAEIAERRRKVAHAMLLSEELVEDPIAEEEEEEEVDGMDEEEDDDGMEHLGDLDEAAPSLQSDVPRYCMMYTTTNRVVNDSGE